MINVLDQPLLKGTHSLIIQPRYLDPTELADELHSVLRAEGYEPSLKAPLGSLILLPLEEAGKLIVFAADASVLRHVKEWVAILDEKRRDGIKSGIFTYEVRNTQAEDMVATLTALTGLNTSQAAGASGASATGPSSGLVVDKNRNLIIYKGSGESWGELLEVIQELDKPTPSVLIEVLLAEITLSAGYGSGIEYLFNSSPGRFDLEGGTLEALGLSSKGLSLVLDNAGATRAVLNLFYEDSRVVIRSSPRLLVKSGGEARIEVGNEIPVITQNRADASTIDGTTNILQQITYRKTGVIMSIKPIVQASGVVDLEITTELSEARPTDSSSLQGAPTILNRTVSTQLTLKDGGSLLMGGIISNSQSAGDRGIPGLAKIPLLGRFFRSDSYQQDRTELMILVIPYVIRDYEEGWALTEQFKQQLELHQSQLSK